MNTNLVYKAIGIFEDQEAVDAYPSWVGARPGDVIFEDVKASDWAGAGKLFGVPADNTAG